MIAAVTGLAAVVAYALLVSVLPSNKLGAVVASMFGPLVGCASVGLYRVLSWRRETTAGFLAATANVAAEALVVAMLLVQIALDHAQEHAPGLDAPTERVFDHVHFGLDLAWDTFIYLGTFLFGLAMLKRPGFGPVVGGGGMVIATAIYAVNFATFPEPLARAPSTSGPLSGSGRRRLHPPAPAIGSRTARGRQSPGSRFDQPCGSDSYGAREAT